MTRTSAGRSRAERACGALRSMGRSASAGGACGVIVGTPASPVGGMSR